METQFRRQKVKNPHMDFHTFSWRREPTTSYKTQIWCFRPSTEDMNGKTSLSNERESEEHTAPCEFTSMEAFSQASTAMNACLLICRSARRVYECVIELCSTLLHTLHFLIASGEKLFASAWGIYLISHHSHHLRDFFWGPQLLCFTAEQADSNPHLTRIITTSEGTRADVM